MDQPWDIAYKEHSVWEALEKARTSLTEVDVPISDYRSVALQSLLSVIDGRRDKPDILITESALDSVEGYLDELIADLSGDLDAIFARPSGVFERLASTVRAWPVTASVNLMGLSNRADELTRIFAASEESILARVDETISTETQRVSRELAAAANDIAEYRSQMDARRDRDVEASEVTRDEINEDLSSITKAVSAAEASATDLMDRISAQDKRLDEVSVERAERFANEVTARQSEWEQIKAEIDGHVAESREAMAEAEKESKNVLANIGVNVTAGEYGAYARLQEKSANKWRLAATISFALAGVVFIAFALAPLLGGTLILSGGSMRSSV